MSRADFKRCALWMILSSLCFSFMALLLKIGAHNVPESVLIFFRSSVMLGLIVTLLAIQRQSPFSLLWKKLLLRSLAGTGAIYFYIHSIAKLDLSRAVLITSTAPLFVVFFAWAFLGEKISLRTLGWIAIAFFGIVLITDPFHEHAAATSILGISYGLISSAFAAVAYTTLRSIGSQVKSEVVVFYFATIATAFSLPAALHTLSSMTLPMTSYLGLFAIGFLGFLGQVFMTYGYRYASATTASSIGLVSIVFSTLWGFLFLKEEPHFQKWLGMFLVITGVLFVGFSQQKHPKIAEKPSKIQSTS